MIKLIKTEEIIELLDDIALIQLIEERKNEESYPIVLEDLLSEN